MEKNWMLHSCFLPVKNREKGQQKKGKKKTTDVNLTSDFAALFVFFSGPILLVNAF